MRVLFVTSAALTATIVVSAASIPRKQPLGRYSELWTDSMMTNERVIVPDLTPPPNPLEDYTLASLCRIGDAWHVILLNKKQRDDRVRLKSGKPNDLGFKVVSVQNATSRQEAEVSIQVAGQTGTVKFESKFLQIRRATGKTSTQRGTARPGRTTSTRTRQPPIPPVPTARSVRKIPVPTKR